MPELAVGSVDSTAKERLSKSLPQRLQTIVIGVMAKDRLHVFRVHSSNHALTEEGDLVCLTVDGKLSFDLFKICTSRVLLDVLDEKVETKERIFVRILDCFSAAKASFLALVGTPAKKLVGCNVEKQQEDSERS